MKAAQNFVLGNCDKRTRPERRPMGCLFLKFNVAAPRSRVRDQPERRTPYLRRLVRQKGSPPSQTGTPDSHSETTVDRGYAHAQAPRKEVIDGSLLRA